MSYKDSIFLGGDGGEELKKTKRSRKKMKMMGRVGWLLLIYVRPKFLALCVGWGEFFLIITC